MLAEDRVVMETFLIKQARLDPNIFIELIMTDEEARPLSQSSIHFAISDFMDRNSRGVIRFPREHGKTTQMVARIAWEIGTDPRLRHKLVSSSDDEAVKRGKAVKELVETPLYNLIFPHIQPGREWTDKRFSVRRDTITPESTLECYGLHSRATGGRADRLWFDDPDDEEVVTSQTKRNRNWDRTSNVWLNQLTPDGKAFILCTPWHLRDISHRLLEQGWPVISFPIQNMIPVWPERWGVKHLEARKADIGSLAFARGFNLVALSEEDTPIQSEWIRFWRNLPQFSAIGVICDPAISLKLSADYSAIGTLGVTRDYNVFVLSVIRKRLTFPKLISELIRAAEAAEVRYGLIPAIGVESTAYQEAIPSVLVKEVKNPIIRLKSSKSKFTRISRLAVHIENGRVWLKGNGSSNSVSKDQESLYDECISYPSSTFDDQVDMLAYGVELMLKIGRRGGAYASAPSTGNQEAAEMDV